jgi:hypothetical protein
MGGPLPDHHAREVVDPTACSPKTSATPRGGFAVQHLSLRRNMPEDRHPTEPAILTVWLHLVGRGRESDLTAALREVPGVLSVDTEDPDTE